MNVAQALLPVQASAVRHWSSYIWQEVSAKVAQALSPANRTPAGPGEPAE
jgi:hypothetical protein